VGRATRPRPVVVGSVRDILQIQQKPEREREMLGWARTWFDAILVHGDPRFARFEETFPLMPELGPPVHYTGFVLTPGERLAVGEGGPRPEVVVSAGGGAVGQAPTDEAWIDWLMAQELGTLLRLASQGR